VRRDAVVVAGTLTVARDVACCALPAVGMETSTS
jgi:hypothetical protein